VLRYDSLQATLYAGTQYQLFKSQNGGVAWKEIPLVPATSFVLPLKFDVKNDTIVYCQGTNVYKSADGGTNWSLIKDNTSYFNNTYSEIRWLGHEVLLIGDQYVLKGFSNGSSWFGVTDNLNSNDDIDDYYQIGERQYVVTNTAKIFSAIGQSAWSQVYNGNGSLIAPEHLFVQHKGRLWMFGSDKSANHTPPANGFLGSWTTATLGGVPTTAQNKAVQFVSVVSTPDAMIAAAPPYGIYISVDDWGIEHFQYTTNLVKGKNAFFLGTKGASVWGRGEALLFRKGLVFLDENGNMAQDSSEAGMANIVIQSSSGYSATTAANGNFNIIVEVEPDTLRAIPLPHMVSIPEFLVASFADSAYVFALQVTDSIQDLCITGLYEADLRPGFQNRLIYTVQNIGTVTTHAIVTRRPSRIASSSGI
jgi:hypothetical protein